MKKLIIFLVFGLLAFGAMAQRVYQLPANQTYFNTAITAADTVTDTGAVTFTLEPARHMPFTYDVKVKLDSITSPNISTQLKGKKFTGDDWSNIGSAVVWSGTSADTTFTISATSVVRWRYLAITATGTGTQKADFNSLEWKIWQD